MTEAKANRQSTRMSHSWATSLVTVLAVGCVSSSAKPKTRDVQFVYVVDAKQEAAFRNALAYEKAGLTTETIPRLATGEVKADAVLERAGTVRDRLSYYDASAFYVIKERLYKELEAVPPPQVSQGGRMSPDDAELYFGSLREVIAKYQTSRLTDRFHISSAPRRASVRLASATGTVYVDNELTDVEIVVPLGPYDITVTEGKRNCSTRWNLFERSAPKVLRCRLEPQPSAWETE